MVKLTSSRLPRHLIVFFSLFLLGIPAIGQGLQIENVAPMRPFNGKIGFEVVNESDTVFMYFLSLQGLDGDTAWVEMRGDLFTNHPTKIAREFSLGKKAAKKQYFYLGARKDVSRSFKMRIVVTFYAGDYRMGERVGYSSAFQVP